MRPTQGTRRSGRLRLVATLGVGLALVSCSEATDEFARPTAVAFEPGGRAVVADGYDHARVALFAPDGTFDSDFGERGTAPGQLETPHGVVVDERGRILVADRENARVQVFDGSGAVLAVWDDPALGRPWALAVQGGHVFVLDGGDQDPEFPRTRVIELDGEGRVLRTFDARASDPPAIDTGHGIAVGRDGSVYVADLEGKRVVKLVRR